jgi:hypothetical protein
METVRDAMPSLAVESNPKDRLTPRAGIRAQRQEPGKTGGVVDK